MWRRGALRLQLRLPAAAEAAPRPPASSPWLGSSVAYSSAAQGRRGRGFPLQSRGMVDRFRLWAKGGEGGNGCFSIRRTRSDRQGKPDGGNGGRGGDVILECSASVWDFSNLQHHMNATRGGHGVSKNQIGTRGSDKFAEVPVGTVIHLVSGEPPSFVVNKCKRSLDPWDILDAVEDSQARSAQTNDKKNNSLASTTKSLDASSRDKFGNSSSLLLPAHEFPDANEMERQEITEKKKYMDFYPWSDREFSTLEDADANSHAYEMEPLDGEAGSEDGKEDDLAEDREVEDSEEEEEKIQYAVAELTKPGQRLLIARGGEGGLGNTSLAKDSRFCRSNKNPDNCRSSLAPGKPGTESLLILELKSIADVGLVGMPNAGKSTLLTALSRARPNIGDYAFTTLRPNIGSLDYDDFFSMKVADIPGLIKGAHENRGLGHAFLRHIERTKVLAYVIDLAATLNGRKGNLPWMQLRDLVMELEYYQENLSKRPSLVVANKIDEDGAKAMFEEFKRRVQAVPIFPVCAVLGEGVPDLRVGLRKLMDDCEPQFVDSSKIIVD